MDLVIRGRRAIVCGASKGLGRGCALALAAEGVDLVINARGTVELEKVAESIRALHGAKVATVAADITTPAGRDAVLVAYPAPDIVITNAGGPPPGDFRDWTREHWIKALDANMSAPIELIKATVDGMVTRRFGRIVNITSAAVRQPIDNLGLSNGARAGLTGFVAGLAGKTVRHNVTINNILPGSFDTDRLRATTAALATQSGRPIEAVHAERAAHNPAGRFGTPAEFGAACAFLCSVHAGHITGANLLLDGGAFPGTL
ncbi:MAG: SDR family oxidoreductase [Alphaproteobacteria bacterium]|nr:SDR family oxidoreductase [Alphaproteobacteria bacterium]